MPALPCGTATGSTLRVYFENEPGRRSAATLLSKGEARRIDRQVADAYCDAQSLTGVDPATALRIEFANALIT